MGMTDRIITSLVTWQQSNVGKKLFELEKNHLKTFIKQNHTDRVLQISGQTYLEQGDAYHYIIVEESDDTHQPSLPSVIANINTKLPFRDESFQTIVLSHTHERVDSLLALLEEIERILMPEGNLIIYGIHSTSLWSIALMFNLYFIPFCKRVYSEHTLTQSIKRVGFEMEKPAQLNISWPNCIDLFNLPRQAHQAIIAKKTVSGMLFNLSV